MLIIKYFIIQYWMWKGEQGALVLEMLDGMLKEKGYNRTELRQFWRDFRKSKKIRKEVIRRLLEK